MVPIGFNISSGFSISGTFGLPDASALPSALTGQFSSEFPLVFSFVVGFSLSVGLRVAFFSFAIGFSWKVSFLVPCFQHCRRLRHESWLKAALVFSFAVGFSRRFEVLFLKWGFSPNRAIKGGIFGFL
jgi:hypothetical protein